MRFSCDKRNNIDHIFGRAGGKAGAVRTCPGCKGRGIKVTIRQIGPGMVQQMQSSCNECSGEGNNFVSCLLIQTPSGSAENICLGCA